MLKTIRQARDQRMELTSGRRGKPHPIADIHVHTTGLATQEKDVIITVYREVCKGFLSLEVRLSRAKAAELADAIRSFLDPVQ